MYHHHQQQQQPSIPPSTPNHHHSVHGNLLEVTVIGCNKLKDTEWISRQDPYVCLEYGSSRNRTRVCTDGGKNPTFQDKFVYSVIEGLSELNVIVWNSNTISRDDFIATGKVRLAKVLSQGYDDSSWPLQAKHGRHAGEVRLIMHYSGANASNYTPSSYVTASAPQVSMYSAPPPPAYPPQAALYPPHPYPPDHSVYPPLPYYGFHYSHGNISSFIRCYILIRLYVNGLSGYESKGLICFFLMLKFVYYKD